MNKLSDTVTCCINCGLSVNSTLQSSQYHYNNNVCDDLLDKSDRMHICYYCQFTGIRDMKFSSKIALMNHISMVHDWTSFACPKCPDLWWNNSTGLRQHLDYYHEIINTIKYGFKGVIGSTGMTGMTGTTGMTGMTGTINNSIGPTGPTGPVGKSGVQIIDNDLLRRITILEEKVNQVLNKKTKFQTMDDFYL